MELTKDTTTLRIVYQSGRFGSWIEVADRDLAVRWADELIKMPQCRWVIVKMGNETVYQAGRA